MTVDSLDVVALAERVGRELAVKTSTLKLGTLLPEDEARLAARLAEAGVELAGKVVRVPLQQQLERALDAAGSDGIDAATLAKAVRGARDAAETKAAIAALQATGAIAILAGGPGKARPLVRRSDAVLSDAELDRLPALAKQLAALAKATRAVAGKPRPTLLRATLAALLGSPSAEPAAAPTEITASPLDALAAALRAAPTHTGLVRVPDVIRGLEAQHPRAALVDALDVLARSGAIELRPEAGLARMADEDRARCLRGLDGTPLSYARVMDGRGEARS